MTCTVTLKALGITPFKPYAAEVWQYLYTQYDSNEWGMAWCYQGPVVPAEHEVFFNRMLKGLTLTQHPSKESIEIVGWIILGQDIPSQFSTEVIAQLPEKKGVIMLSPNIEDIAQCPQQKNEFWRRWKIFLNHCKAISSD